MYGLDIFVFFSFFFSMYIVAIDNLCSTIGSAFSFLPDGWWFESTQRYSNIKFFMYYIYNMNYTETENCTTGKKGHFELV